MVVIGVGMCCLDVAGESLKYLTVILAFVMSVVAVAVSPVLLRRASASMVESTSKHEIVSFERKGVLTTAKPPAVPASLFRYKRLFHCWITRYWICAEKCKY